MAKSLPPNALKVREILKDIQKNLQCPICLELLSDPHKTPCGHSYCKECIITAITSTKKKPKCPLCKEPVTKRSLSKNERLADIIDAVGDLEQAIIKDTGITSTPPKVVPHNSGVSGTPGVQLHSILHPTPLKPRPQADGQCEESECSDDGETGSPSTIYRKKQTVASCNGAGSSSHPPTSHTFTQGRHKKVISSQATSSSSSEVTHKPTSSNREREEENPHNNPATEALLQALKGATLRLPDTQQDEEAPNEAIGERWRRRLRPRDQIDTHPPSPSPSPAREEVGGERGRERKRAKMATKSRRVTWFDSSSESDSETPPILQVATPLRHNQKIAQMPLKMLNSRHCSSSVASNSVASSSMASSSMNSCGEENWTPQATSSASTRDAGRETAATLRPSSLANGVKRLRRKPRALKQPSLELFCSCRSE